LTGNKNCDIWFCMPRSSRIVIMGYPHHVVQRGHNRQDVFISYEDYQFYLENLREWKEKLGCKVYAYCLMTNHIHLIVDPGEDENNLAQLIKRVAGRQTRYVNKREKRTGSLWEGRYKSSTISTNEYLLACCRYIELNPVRAGIVADPLDYRWSSYRSKTGKHKEEWLDFDPCYMGLAGNKKARAEKYMGWVKGTILEGELELIRQSLQRGQLTGSARFVEEIEQKTKKRVEFRGQGRPRKTIK
jgi:putative transposase